MTVAAGIRRNPLRTYTFRLRFAGQETAFAGLRKVSGLTMAVQAHEIWEGGNSLHRFAQPDRATWEPVTLEQGLALDDSLEEWARACATYLETGRAPSGQPVKRNVVIEVWDPLGGSSRLPPGSAAGGETPTPRSPPPPAQGGSPAAPLPGSPTPTAARRDYEVVNAWVSRFQALPALDAMANEVGLLLVEFIHEGWHVHQRSTSGSG